MTEQRRAWAYLSRVVEPPCAELSALVARVGPVEAAERVRRGAVSAELARRTEARRDIDCAADDLDRLDRLGGRLAHAGRRRMADSCARVLQRRRRAPPARWRRATGAVGARRCGDRRGGLARGRSRGHPRGHRLRRARRRRHCRRGSPSVTSRWSPAPRSGSTAAAHRAALAADGCTVAVLAGGVDVPYPAGHSALLHRIQRAGLVVSEYPPGVRPARHRFLVRNRLVAALSRATWWWRRACAAERPTPRHGRAALGRVVCAVPGPVTSSASAGCHVLIRQGTELVTRAEEDHRNRRAGRRIRRRTAAPVVAAGRPDRHRTTRVRSAARPRRALRRRVVGRVRAAGRRACRVNSLCSNSPASRSSATAAGDCRGRSRSNSFRVSGYAPFIVHNGRNAQWQLRQ